MGSILLETVLSSIVFFGCEAAAISQVDMDVAMSSGLEQCPDIAPAVGNNRGLSALSLAACRVDGEQSEKLAADSENYGELIGQNNNLLPVFNEPRGGGVIGSNQPGPDASSILLTATPSTVLSGENTMLHWDGNNVSDCTASGGWNGKRQVTGSESTDAVAVTTNYVLTCRGANGTVSNAATVWVDNQNAPPTVSLVAEPDNIDSGTASTLTWTTTNADNCTASYDWSGPRPIAGSESTGILEQTSRYTLNCTGPGGSAGDTVVVSVDGVQAPPATFTRIVVSEDQAPWGKNLADVDGDGSLDILHGGGGATSNVYWYRAPSWQRYQIGSAGGGDDLQTGDINGDGAIDVVVNRDPIAWYENPVGSGGNPEDPWTMHTIANYRSHDIEIIDMNNDGKLDVVIRMAGLVSPATRVFLQGSDSDTWTTIGLFKGEKGTGGLAVADIDDDGRMDVVGDGYWLRQPAQNITDGDTWLQYTIDTWPAGSSIDTADLNGDGNVDVTLAVSEVGVGDLAWFEAPDDPLTQPWIRHTIGTVEDVHRHHLVDMNNDGSLDIVFAEMFQSATDRVGIYYNDGNAENWTLQVIETHASHNIVTGDIDNDGDMDIMGANWRLYAPAQGDVLLWINGIN